MDAAFLRGPVLSALSHDRFSQSEVSTNGNVEPFKAKVVQDPAVLLYVNGDYVKGVSPTAEQLGSAAFHPTRPREAARPQPHVCAELS